MRKYINARVVLPLNATALPAQRLKISKNVYIVQKRWNWSGMYLLLIALAMIF